MNTIKQNIVQLIIFIVVMWFVFLLNSTGLINSYGVIPREMKGLIGILTCPFFHVNITHILFNTLGMIPFMIIFSLLEGKDMWGKILFIVIIGGIFTWLMGRSANHVGASGLIFGLYGYLATAGFFNKKILHLVVSIFVVSSYGYMIWGVLPLYPGVSWEGHLFGLIAGIILSFIESKLLQREA